MEWMIRVDVLRKLGRPREDIRKHRSGSSIMFAGGKDVGYLEVR